MKKYFKIVDAYFISLAVLLTSCFVYNLPVSARSADYVADVLDVVDYNVKRAVDTVQNGTRVGWDIINKGIDTIGHIFAPSRTTYTPTSDYNDAPVSSSTYNDYTLNYYTVDNTSSSYNETTYNAYNNYSSSYYDYITNQYYETTNNYVTNNTYNTYDYTFNDNRVFVTETYNSIIYTYINPETRTVDSYMCAFAMPTGDSSFNYSSGYCKGLYWIYGVTNYDYEMDDDNLLAYWRLDGDLNNEVPNSPFRLNYYANEFGDGKFSYALRCNGPFDMVIDSSDSSMLPGEFTLCGWYFNGDVNYTAISQGWHYYCWVVHPHSSTNKRELYIDGILTPTTDSRSQVFISHGGISLSNITSNAYAFRSYSNSRSGRLISAYHPLVNENFPYGEMVFNGQIFLDWDSQYFNIAQSVFGSSRGDSVSDIGIGSNSPYPLHYAPIVDDYRITFLYTGSNDTSLSGSALFWASGSDYVSFTHPYEGALGVNANCFDLPDGTIYFSGNHNLTLTRNLSNPSIYGGSDSINVPTQYPSFGDSDIDSLFDRYDLSSCYWDEIRIFKGARYDLCEHIQVSRQELEVGYTVPSTFNRVNGIGLQSTVPVNQFRIGGVIPTIAHEGDVWFKIVNGYCTSCVQFYSGAWHEVNFGVFDGSTWRNGYTYNFYNLSFDATDYDTGTVPTSVINYYYGDTYNVYNDYFKDNQSEKENALSWWTSLIGLISGAFTAIVPFLTSYLGFLPFWLTVPFLTFIPILLILLIVKIKDIFK